MAATALIRFSQGPIVGADGQALKGVLDTAVVVQNSNNADVASWQIDLVYVDPASAIVPATPYAFSDSGNTPTATFTPDVRGCYRLVLKVWEAPNRIGPPVDTDIRIFAVPEINGLVVPAVQLLPRPSTEKPSEFNFGGQTFGWAGDGSSDGLLNVLVRRVDNLSSATSVQEAVPVLSEGQTIFTLSRSTTSDSTVLMYINGTKAVQGLEYTASGATVTYTGSNPILTTDNVEFWYIVGGQLVGNNSARQESLPVTIEGQTSFVLSEAPTSASTVEMFVNSAKMQYGVDYSVVGHTVNYTGAIDLQTTDVVEFWYVIGPITVDSSLYVTVPNGLPQRVNSAVVPPGCKVLEETLHLFQGGQNTADVTLSLNSSTAVLPITFSGLGNNRYYTCTFGYRCVIWPSANRANAGSMDCVVDLYIATNGSGVATVTVQTTPSPNVSRLPTAIATATTTVSASTGGVTIYVTRPTGVNCLVRAKWWAVEFEDIT